MVGLNSMAKCKALMGSAVKGLTYMLFLLVSTNEYIIVYEYQQNINI